MNWHTLNFGKHEGRSFPQVAFRDPDWLYWAVEHGALGSGVMAAQLNEVARKARCILIPCNEDERLQVRCLVDRGQSRISRICIVERTIGERGGSSFIYDLPYFDLSLARRLCPYDKAGGRKIVAAIKRCVLGDPDIYLTKALVEAFFADDCHFGEYRPDRR